MNTPQINVTPLIDVLLVLLIIFMVVSPLKPSAFKARIPSEPTSLQSVKTNDKALVVVVGSDRSLHLNNQPAGAIGDEQLSKSLADVFAARIANGDISDSFADEPARPFNDRIERTVFIKAPMGLDYGSVARVVDAAKLAGAYPISLQIDRLDE
jgi:biopolymer transport protein TolR